MHLIAAVVIASGYSRRMGQSKLALELGGITFLDRAIAAAAGASRIARCLVVLRPEDVHLVGHPPPQPSPAGGAGAFLVVEGAWRVEIVPNEHAAEGQSASIRLATERLFGDPDCQAIIFSVVDQPFLTSSVFDLLCEAAEESPGQILVSTYASQRGSPVLFPRRYFSELLGLEGDVGGREIMRRHPEAVKEIAMPDSEAGRDVDTWEDYLLVRRAVTVTDTSAAAGI